MIDLRLGDCLEEIEKIEDKSIDTSFTSPPYNRKRNDKYEKFKDINIDWFSMNINIITELLRVTKNHVIYNIQANYYNRKDVYNIIGYFSDKIVDIHIWEKSNPMPASGKAITNSVEYFLILGDRPLKSNKTYTKNIITTSVNSSMPKELKAVMKYSVAEHFIKNFTKKGDLILDCFLGYATTAIACINLERRFIGIELKPFYLEMSKKRVEEKTKEKDDAAPF